MEFAPSCHVTIELQDSTVEGAIACLLCGFVQADQQAGQCSIGGIERRDGIFVVAGQFVRRNAVWRPDRRSVPASGEWENRHLCSAPTQIPPDGIRAMFVLTNSSTAADEVKARAEFAHWRLRAGNATLPKMKF